MEWINVKSVVVLSNVVNRRVLIWSLTLSLQYIKLQQRIRIPDEVEVCITKKENKKGNPTKWEKKIGICYVYLHGWSKHLPSTNKVKPRIIAAESFSNPKTTKNSQVLFVKVEWGNSSNKKEVSSRVLGNSAMQCTIEWVNWCQKPAKKLLRSRSQHILIHMHIYNEHTRRRKRRREIMQTNIILCVHEDIVKFPHRWQHFW
jgi:hypothetical protein